MYFFVKTHNPRPTFHLDMTDDERAIMQRHVVYWSEKAAQGIAVVFGPVMDPEGVYGIGIFQARDEAEIRVFLQDDPANGLLSYDFFPMAQAIIGNVQRT